ncbi:DUF4258 domain-containing protein [Candidatus Peregrinibacteria bacterium]|nr:DUF4258 domain-containing protein [Candidatus Peregrinibacteria bacterium]
MKIVFSKHAENRMNERQISKNEVKEAILFPNKSGKQDHKNFAMKTRKNDQLLIAYYIEEEGVAHVITVITTSKISKYLQ